MAETKLAYHRRFRPATLKQYKGNQLMVEQLHRILHLPQLPQVLLFEGPSGCGKTSVARLLATEYKCTDKTEDGYACGECDDCVAMRGFILDGDTSSLMDMIEIDVAETSSKDELGRILDTASTPAFGGGWKVYIFDECHMAAVSAQNRFLKLTEEPPEGVLFIFCTTDPQKILPTLLARCQYRFKVSKPSTDVLVEHLKEICLIEGVESDTRGLQTICIKSSHVPRMALINLEAVITQMGNALSSSVNKVLCSVSDELYFEFFTHLLSFNAMGYFTLLAHVQNIMALELFVQDMAEFIKRGVWIYNGVHIEGLSVDDSRQYKRLFKQFSDAQLLSILSELLLMRADAQSIETRLLRLVYSYNLQEGNPPKDSVVSSDSASKGKDTTLAMTAKASAPITAKAELTAGVAAYTQGTTFTLDEQDAVVGDDSADVVSADDLLSLFGGSLLTPLD